ncbi:MAG: hypothetical protein ABI165_11495 [Bryobacteraceae bacterium]
MAIVIAPGGGHWQLNMIVDGWPVADWLNMIRIAAFVLKYGLAKATDSGYTVEGD